MHICIAVCTFNRSEMLRDTLASVLAMEMPSDWQVELLVVDNNSTDDTHVIIEEFQKKWPPLVRYLFVGTAGLSHARNAAIGYTYADIIAYIDDDVFLDRHWLLGLTSFFDGHPEAMCVGGASVPHFEEGTPAWLSERILKIFGSTASGDQLRPMLFPEHPFGVNMAFRREVFQRVGQFSTILGRIGTNLLSGEETELFYRIHAAGLSVYFVPNVRLLHRIPATRTSQRWVLQRFYWQGVSDVVLDVLTRHPCRRRLLREAFWTLRSLVEEIPKHRVFIKDTPAGRAESLGHRAFLYYRFGKLKQYFLYVLRYRA